MPHYLEQLNPNQRKAVEHIEGPMMIVAGAGSGKTRVLTYRIAHLIENGVDPFNILALTFTNKAAREMKDRIGKLVGHSQAKSLWMGTFHSVFMKILIAEAELIGYPKFFTIYDTDDAKSVVTSCIKELGLDKEIYKPKLVASRISNLKNELITPQNYDKFPELYTQDASRKCPKFIEIYQMYVDRCFKAGAMDFDDLLLKTNELLYRFPEVLAKYQDMFRYILVDEYQDTNRSQYLIVKNLGDRFKNVCVVGDDAQSIYAFRGATIQNILNFNKDYPEAKTFKLEQNYRSSGSIVKAADSVIKKNKEQLDKDIWTANENGEPISVVANSSDNDEGYFIARTIKDNIQKQTDLSFADFAVLYRTNAQSRAVEDAMRRLQIPYVIYGGKSFYSRKEIKDALAYLRLAINPKDEEALLRVINYPTRGIGETTMQKIILAARHYKRTPYEVIKNIEKLPQLEINQGTRKKLTDFVELINYCQAIAEQKNAFDTTREIIQKSGILEMLFNSTDSDDKQRYENVLELASAAQDFVETQKELAETTDKLADFIQGIPLMTDQDKAKDDDNKVSLMTIHASKGLEFNTVFIAGMEEELFPGNMSVGTRAELEEERRLFYVALTRAEKRAYLSYALERSRFGTKNFPEPSRFIDELDQNFIKFTSPREDLKPKSFQSSPNSTKFAQAPTRNTNSFYKKLTPIEKSSNNNVKNAEQENIAAGDRVKHDRFGEGVIIEITGEGADLKAKVNFDEQGEKLMLLRFAKIVKI